MSAAMDGPAVRLSAPSTITKQPRTIVIPVLMFGSMDGEAVEKQSVKLSNRRPDDQPGTSAPIPTFASYRGTLSCERRNQKEHWKTYDSSAVFEFEIPRRLAAK